MSKKKLFFAGAATLFFAAFLIYTFAEDLTEPPGLRSPASIPNNYDSLPGCLKQKELWQKIVDSRHLSLKDKPNRKLGALQVLAMSRQEISLKGSYISDFAPQGWKKYLHGRGSVAKVKIVPISGNYTGIFQGAECGLLRLSLTYAPIGDRPVAPGLALKILRDGIHSANISALVSLDGQSLQKESEEEDFKFFADPMSNKDFNFFANPMSNIVAPGDDIGQRLVHRIFKKVSDYPEELRLEDMAAFDATGAAVANFVSPRQLFFVPGESFAPGGNLKFSESEHEIREDFHKIPPDTLIYKIYAVSDRYKDFDYSTYTESHSKIFLKEAQHIANIVSIEENFISSDFGDDGIFFRHQVHERKKY
jgi:hypothetical protein